MDDLRRLRCTNFRVLSDWENAAAVLLFRSLSVRQACAPERTGLGVQGPVFEPEDKRAVKSGICKRCGVSHSWRLNGGNNLRLYCDACKRY